MQSLGWPAMKDRLLVTGALLGLVLSLGLLSYILLIHPDSLAW